jgi:hypothetical protein
VVQRCDNGHKEGEWSKKGCASAADRLALHITTVPAHITTVPAHITSVPAHITTVPAHITTVLTRVYLL